MKKRIGFSSIVLDSNFEPQTLVKRFKGLIKIDSDLIIIQEKLTFIINECAVGNHTHFHDYQGTMITYRKCFLNDDSRGVKLTPDNHLRSATKEQQELHDEIINIANKHVAHAENEEYERVSLYLVLEDWSGRAIDIDKSIDLWEPLSCPNFENLSGLIRLIRENLAEEVNKLQNKIIQEWNSKHSTTVWSLAFNNHIQL